ncbi:MAG TPA: cupin domain-containing protein [Patescibacteria group bacterium]|nr:cupin domain-containing protein [Patescibacteria group bacterium]
MRSKATNPRPAIEVHAKPGQPLGMPTERFLSVYWQKRPLLIRGMLGADFASPITPNDLAGLACEPYALARLVTHDPKRDRWTLECGPFEEARFSKVPKSHWTLLVQDVDKWDRDVTGLLDHVAFLPRWRVDDIMISYAVEGGGVGAHVDQYDVFLIQGLGQRRWRIDVEPNPPKEFRPEVELKQLMRFSPSHEWVLSPGDVLYLPPGVPHDGVALVECMTLSIGMRAPSEAELLVELSDQIAETLDDADRYTDPELHARTDVHAIDASDIGRVRRALSRFLQMDDDALGHEFARFITRYRNAQTPAPRPRGLTAAQFATRVAKGTALARHPFARMATRAGKRGRSAIFLAGQGFETSTRLAKLLGGDEIAARDVAALADSERADLLKWLNLGLIGFLS